MRIRYEAAVRRVELICLRREIFFTARQLSNFKYDGIYRNKSGGNKCGGGSASLKIATKGLTQALSFPLSPSLWSLRAIARVSLATRTKRVDKEESLRMRRRHEEASETGRGEDATGTRRTARGQGGDWQAFYYIPLVGDKIARSGNGIVFLSLLSSLQSGIVTRRASTRAPRTFRESSIRRNYLIRLVTPYRGLVF